MLKRTLVMFALALTGTLTISAAVRGPAARISTVGEFAARLAVVLGQDGRDARAASSSLERLGVQLPLQSEAPLTDGLVARIATDLGVGILAPDEPQAEVTVARAAVIAKLIGMRMAGSGVDASVEPPTECLQSQNRGQCVECCKEALGPVTNPQGNTRDAGKECSQFCHSNVPPPPSDFEPEP